MLQIGQAGKPGGNDSKTALNRPTAIAVDSTANEIYVADGVGNRRIVVFDATTGAYKRHWGAYGAAPGEADPGPYNPSEPPSKQFRTVELRRDLERRTGLCLRSSQRSDSGVSQGRHVREGSVRVEDDYRRGRRVGCGVLSRPAAALPLRGRRPGSESVRARSRHARGRFELWAGADGGRADSTGLAAWPWTRKATSTRERTSKASASRNSSTNDQET